MMLRTMMLMMMMLVLELVRGAESSVVNGNRELRQSNNNVVKQLKLVYDELKTQTGNYSPVF